MTHTRLVLAASTAAAAVISAAPMIQHGSTPASGPLQVGSRSGTTALVVPANAHLLTAQVAGSAAVETQTRVRVVRTSDGATLFEGSLATFRALQVAPGTNLLVRVQRPSRYAALKAASVLQWS